MPSPLELPLFEPAENKYKVAPFSSIGPVEISSNENDPVNIKPDVVAPGADIVAGRVANKPFGGPIYTNRNLEPPLQQYYTFKSGTSMATPIVSGSIALLLEAYKRSHGINNEDQWKNEKLKPVENSKNLAHFIKTVIMQTAMMLDKELEYESLSSDKSVVFGTGFIQVDKCIERILGYYPPFREIIRPAETPSTRML